MTRLPKSRLERRIARVEKAKVKARLQAKYEWNRSKVGQKAQTQAYIKRAIERIIDKIDPIETPVILGVTYIVKNIIDKSEELTGAVMAIHAKGIKFPPTPFWGDITAIVTGAMREHFAKEGIDPYAYLPGAPKINRGETTAYEGLLPDWADWIVALSIAYMLVRHGGDLISAFGGLPGAIKGFLLPGAG